MLENGIGGVLVQAYPFAEFRGIHLIELLTESNLTGLIFGLLLDVVATEFFELLLCPGDDVLLSKNLLIYVGKISIGVGLKNIIPCSNHTETGCTGFTSGFIKIPEILNLFSGFFYIFFGIFNSFFIEITEAGTLGGEIIPYALGVELDGIAIFIELGDNPRYGSSYLSDDIA